MRIEDDAQGSTIGRANSSDRLQRLLGGLREISDLKLEIGRVGDAKLNAVTARLGALETELCEAVKVVAAMGNSDETTVAVVGDFSSGKSTFINALIQRNICPVDVAPTTSAITTFSFGSEVRGFRVDEAGQRQPVSKRAYRELAQSGSSDGASLRFEIEVPHPVLQGLKLIDTPGFSNPRNPLDTRTTEAAVEEADVLMVLMDAERGNPSAPLLEQLDRLRRIGCRKRAFLLINKADLKRTTRERAKILEVNRERLSQYFERVEMVSAEQIARSLEADAIGVLEEAHERALQALRGREPSRLYLQFEEVRSPNGKAAFELRYGDTCVRVPARAQPDIAGRELLTEMLRDLTRPGRLSNHVSPLACWQRTMEHVEQELAHYLVGRGSSPMWGVLRRVQRLPAPTS